MTTGLSHTQAARLASVIVAACAFALQVQGPARAASIERVSISSAGAEANGDSWGHRISADGRFVAFESDATNLVPGDTNRCRDIFVRDRRAGTTERVSISSDYRQANGKSQGCAISPDGRFVAFCSAATNLVPGDSNSQIDVFLRDRLAGTTERVSLGGLNQQANGVCSSPSVSRDGRLVAFASEAGNLVSGDTNRRCDVFVRDRSAGTTERVSVANSGAQANAPCGPCAMTPDGRFVVFDSRASDLVADDVGGWLDVFIHDRQTRTTERVSVGRNGQGGNQDSFGASITPDGRFVVFISQATSFVPGDTNWQSDIYLRDREAGITERESWSMKGEEPNHYSGAPCLSADGRVVAFDSRASNLVAGDTNGAVDVFTNDRSTTTIAIVSVSDAGEIGNDHSNWPSISADGRFVSFSSEASNLVPDDTNNVRDIFVRDLGPDFTMAARSAGDASRPAESGHGST